jgi:hypothetical protein
VDPSVKTGGGPYLDQNIGEKKLMEIAGETIVFIENFAKKAIMLFGYGNMN